MTNQNEIVIKDSCLLFDLLELELIDAFFQMNFTVCTTQEVIDEVTDPDQRDIVEGYIGNGLLIIEKSGNFEELTTFSNKYKGLSWTDCSVLELALRKRATVLTSDRLLKKISIDNGLSSNGLLWIISQLVDGKIIPEEKGIESLVSYSSFNKRAPSIEITRLIESISVRIATRKSEK